MSGVLYNFQLKVNLDFPHSQTDLLNSFCYISSLFTNQKENPLVFYVSVTVFFPNINGLVLRLGTETLSGENYLLQDTACSVTSVDNTVTLSIT